jgi:hypothetical protein
MPTFYEWVVEHVDEHGDIVDVFHGDKLAAVLPWVGAAPSGFRADIGLVRDQLDRNDNLDRSWAYVDEDGLAEEFDNGRRVPKRFLAEWASAGEPRPRAAT